MRYQGIGRSNPLGVRMPRHIRPMHYRPGLGNGSLDALGLGRLGSPGGSAGDTYAPGPGWYLHDDPIYEPPDPWFEGHQGHANTGFPLGRPSIYTHSEPELTPDYDDALMTSELASAMLDALLGHGEVPASADVLELGPINTALICDPPGVMPSPLDDLVDASALEAERTSLEALSQTNFPEPLDGLTAPSFDPPEQRLPEEELDALTAMQHELMMRPPTGYGPMPGLMPGPG